MAKGDALKVTYRTGVGTETVEIVCRTDGYKLDWDAPKDRDRFLEVQVQGRTGKAVEIYLFASADVVAIVSGHKTKAQMAPPPRPLGRSTAKPKANPAILSPTHGDDDRGDRHDGSVKVTREPGGQDDTP